MTEWNRVKWTEAGQVTRLLKWKDGANGSAGQSPQAFFAGLRAEGRLCEAAEFLGQALPRFEAVAWAARSVRDLVNGRELDPGDARALKSALLWVQDPSENRRRTAFDAAMAAEASSPGRMAALAAFFSGGSIAPPEVDPIPAPKEAAGRFAAGAVIAAAAQSGDMSGCLSKSLDGGEAIARRGLDRG